MGGRLARVEAPGDGVSGGTASGGASGVSSSLASCTSTAGGTASTGAGTKSPRKPRLGASLVPMLAGGYASSST